MTLGDQELVSVKSIFTEMHAAKNFLNYQGKIKKKILSRDFYFTKFVSVIWPSPMICLDKKSILILRDLINCK